MKNLFMVNAGLMTALALADRDEILATVAVVWAILAIAEREGKRG